MNAVMTMPIASKATGTSHPSVKVGGEQENSGIFAELLESQFAPEMLQLTEQESAPSFNILNWIQSLIEQDIEMNQGEHLEDEAIQTLLSLLPENWKEELVEWLNLDESSNMPVYINETLIDTMPDWSDEQLIVAGLVISQLIETGGNERLSSLSPQEVNSELAQLFPIHRSDQHMDKQELKVERIIDQLQQIVEKVQQMSKGIGRGMNLPIQQDTNDESLIIHALQKLTSEKEDIAPPFNRSGVGSPPNQGLTLPPFGLDAGQMMTRTQQAVIHIGDQLPKEVQQEQLLKQFQQVMQRGLFKTNEVGMNTFSVKLFPAHLGRLDIQLTQVEGVIVARLITSSATAKDLVESQLQHLRQAFINQQLNVERVEVVNQHHTSVKDDQSSNKDQTSDERKKQDTESEEDNDSFQAFLEELTINEKV